jgi:DNA-binding transcriptional LysR family regulator
MDEKDWRMLEIIYQERNITKAAEQLYISQPSLTYRIKQLEREFGVKILSRKKRGVDFTAEGEYLVSYAGSMLRQLRETKDYLNNLDQTIKGTLRLGVSQTHARYELPQVLAQFLAKHPEVDLDVRTGYSLEVLQMMQQEEVSIGIVRDPYDWKGPKALMGNEGIYLVSKDEIDMEKLPYLPRIDYRTDLSLKNRIDKWWKASFELPPKVAMRVDLIDTCREMVHQGLGYAILPEICLKDSSDLHRYELKIGNEKLTRQTWLLFDENSSELSVVDAFIEFIQGRERGDTQ